MANATMSQRILDLKKAQPNLSAKEIAAKLKTSLRYVYTTVYMEKKRANKAKPTGSVRRTIKRKAKPKVTAVSKSQIVHSDAAAAQQKEDMYSSAITGLQKQTVALRKEIYELTTIIAYLEHRCAKAEAKNGVAV